VFTVLLPWIDWYAKVRIEYIAIPVAVALGYMIVNTLFPEILHKIGLYIIYTVTAIYIVLFMFADTVFMSHALQPLYAVYTLASIYLLVCFCHLRCFNPEQLIFLGGLVLFILSAVNDYLYYSNIWVYGFLGLGELTGIAMLVFALCAAASVFISTMKELEAAKQRERELAFEKISLEERIGLVQTQLAGLLDQKSSMPNDIFLGPLTLKRVSNRAYLFDIDMSLSPKEFALLLLFVTHAGQLLDSAYLYEKAWDLPMNGDKQTLQNHVSSLRKKLEDGDCGYTISSIYGKGYRFEEV